MNPLTYYPDQITQQPDGSYKWQCSIDVEYHRHNMRVGMYLCFGIGAFLLFYGVFLSWRFHDWKSLLIVAGSVLVFLLITLLAFWPAIHLVKAPMEQFWMSDIDIHVGTGRNSVFFYYKNARTVIVHRDCIELQNKYIKKVRVYAPSAEDLEFVRKYILNRVPGDAEIRYER